jgi:hypothetical protein
MVDMTNAEHVPTRVMDLLRIFLAARSRGEQVVLILDTRKKPITPKYRSVETVAGTPAHIHRPPVNNNKARKNPARARKSSLRLEKFVRSPALQLVTPATSSEAETTTSTNRLVVQLSNEKGRSVREVPSSPIPQVDGAAKDVPKQ